MEQGVFHILDVKYEMRTVGEDSKSQLKMDSVFGHIIIISIYTEQK
jgi:hypothetical protein